MCCVQPSSVVLIIFVFVIVTHLKSHCTMFAVSCVFYCCGWCNYWGELWSVVLLLFVRADDDQWLQPLLIRLHSLVSVCLVSNVLAHCSPRVLTASSSTQQMNRRLFPCRAAVVCWVLPLKPVTWSCCYFIHILLALNALLFSVPVLRLLGDTHCITVLFFPNYSFTALTWCHHF